VDLLHNSGWYEQTRQTAAVTVKEHEMTSSSSSSTINGADDEPSDLDLIFGKVQEESWGKVSDSVKREMYKEILVVLHQILSGK